MPFGRYQGTTIRELPSDYIDWMFGKFESYYSVMQMLKTSEKTVIGVLRR